MANAEKTWAEYERQRLALQQFSPRFSRAEMCRRAGISESTVFKGLHNDTQPTRGRGAAVARAIEAETERLPEAHRQQLELVLEAERHMVEAGLRS